MSFVSHTMFLCCRYIVSLPFDWYSEKYVVSLCVLFKIVAKYISPSSPRDLAVRVIQPTGHWNTRRFCTRRYSLVSFRPARWPEGKGDAFLRVFISTCLWIQYLGERAEDPTDVRTLIWNLVLLQAGVALVSRAPPAYCPSLIRLLHNNPREYGILGSNVVKSVPCICNNLRLLRANAAVLLLDMFNASWLLTTFLFMWEDQHIFHTSAV